MAQAMNGRGYEDKNAPKAVSQYSRDALTSYVLDCWQEARNARSLEWDDKLIQALFARRGEYTPEKLVAVQSFGGSDIYIRVVATKARAVAAWLKDVLVSASDKPWGLSPSPVPELPDTVTNIVHQQVQAEADLFKQIQGFHPDPVVLAQFAEIMHDMFRSRIEEDAKIRAERAEDYVEDVLAEARFGEHLSDFIDDLVTFPYAIMKGPTPIKSVEFQWGANFQPIKVDKIKLGFKRISPFDFYWAPSATTTTDGYVIERVRYAPGDLYACIGVEGYREEAIRKVLEEYNTGQCGSQWLAIPTDSERAQGEGKRPDAFSPSVSGLIDALEFYGCIQGQQLIDYGVERVADPDKSYECCVIIVDNNVVKLTLNEHPLYDRPYRKSSFETIPGSFAGQSLFDVLQDVQDMVNGCGRALVNNMSMASGPMVGVLADRLASGSDVSALHPWKTFEFQADPYGQNNGQPPIQFFQPSSNAGELIAVIDKFMQYGDDISGMPRYMQGVSTTASRTASGLSMLMDAAGKNIKQVIVNIDKDVIKPAVREVYIHEMIYNPDESIKGDLQVIAKGATAIAQKDVMRVRKQEFLQATANPFDMQIMTPIGRGALLRDIAGDLGMPADSIVPSMEMQHLQQFQHMQQQVQGPGPQAPEAQGMQGQLANPAQPGPGQTLDNGAPVTNLFQNQ